MKEKIKLILDISDKTYYNWKKEQRPIILLLEKYFSKEDLEEFLSTGIIEKLEKSNTEETIDNKEVIVNFTNTEVQDDVIQENLKTLETFQNTMAKTLKILIKKEEKREKQIENLEAEIEVLKKQRVILDL